MPRLLVSWLAFAHDFIIGEGPIAVNPAGPTAGVHQHFWAYDRHLILSQNSEERGDPRAVALVGYLNREHRGRPIEVRYMGLSDVIDVREIKEKVERLLAEISPSEVDVYVSPGTPAMQVAWYLAAGARKDVRLFQVRPGRHRRDGVPEQIFFETESSPEVASLVLREAGSSTAEAGAPYRGPTLSAVYHLAQRVAATDRVTALLVGESGTGKEGLARFIHEQSIRKQGPFVALNCAAFRTDELLESRLFGYRKGAFTGADRDTPGLVEAAEGGTLFLDEIGDISPAFQATLLRVLQEREYTRVGDTKARRADVRIVAATHRDLARACAEGSFRWDLYYRLAVADITLPPLRQWPAAEVEALLDHLLQRKAEMLGRAPLALQPAARRVLTAYGWPGNVREMEHLVERLYVFADNPVRPEDLPQRLSVPSGSASLKLADVEREHITTLYARYGQNKQRTADALGIALNTLKKRLSEYGLAPPPRSKPPRPESTLLKKVIGGDHRQDLTPRR